MRDKELIQNLRICGKGGNCLGCELDGKCSGINSILTDAGNRLEALLAENERFREATKKTPKPLTTADRIRDMTDKELAKCLAKFIADYTSLLYDGDYTPSDEAVCKVTDELLRQLQQPCEDSPTVEKG